MIMMKKVFGNTQPARILVLAVPLITNFKKMIVQNHYYIQLFYLPFLFVLLLSCGKNEAPPETEVEMEEETEDDLIEGVDYFLPDIDLNNWKVTLPIGNPTEVKPPAILDYANNEMLKEFMYNDSTDGSLVFYTYPGSTTTNTSYSRTELREQMQPGSNAVNWTFAQGGRMKGRLAVPEVSKDSEDKYHRVIIMQIHGRLTNEQRDLIGEDDNNAPPMLKIYWQGGKIRVKTKVLKDLNASDTEILKTSAWGDDDGFNFSEEVGHEPFELEVIVSDGRMEVLLNGEESKVYEDIHMQKWGVFENYFKAGNYLQTIDSGAYSRVNYYELEVSH